MQVLDPTDARERPLYGQREAASIVDVSPSTLRRWIGPSGNGPLIQVADPQGRRLSFNNVIEAYVLRSLQTKHSVSSAAVRQAVGYAERELGVDRLLLRQELRWSGDLFLDRLSDLVNLSRTGQFAMKEVLESYLNRVEWDDASDLPSRLFPRVPQAAADTRSVVVDPRLAFGQPTVTGTGVGTSIIAQRINAGESFDDVARDYGIARRLVEEAVLYEEAV